MHSIRGLLFIKHGAVGTRSEGPLYFLQTEHKDVRLRFEKRHPWELDYVLEHHNRHIVEVSGENVDGETFQVKRIRRLVGKRIPEAEPFEQRPEALVLSTDVVGGLVAPNVLVNHVMQTRVYGDGKVVFIDPAVGNGMICEGRLTDEQITELFYLLEDHGFWTFADSYTVVGPTDMPSTVVMAHRRGEVAKSVSCYAGDLSAPSGFMDCHTALLYPQLLPSSVLRYERLPITKEDLKNGWYFGMEYQKKLHTPVTWVWADAGRSSKWHAPA